MSDLEFTFAPILQQFGFSGDDGASVHSPFISSIRSPLAGWQVRPWKGEGYSGSQIWQVSREISTYHDLEPANANEMIAIASPATHALGAIKFCLKAQPHTHADWQRIHWQAALIRRASELPFLLQPCTTLQNDFAWVHAGRVWQLEPWATGTNDFHQNPNSHRVVNVMRALAELHNLWFQRQQPAGDGASPNQKASFAPANGACCGPSPGLAKRLAMSEQWSPRISDFWKEIVNSIQGTGEDKLWLAAVNEVRQLTELQWSTVCQTLAAAQEWELPMGPVLGDPWSDHLFFEGDKLSSIIDYGALRVDSVAADLSRTLCSLAGDNSRLKQLALSEYQMIRKLDERETQSIEAYNLSSRVLGPLLWLRWIFLEQRFPPNSMLRDRLLKISRSQPF